MTARKRMRQSKRQERAVAKHLGGSRVPGSGSGDEKADGRVLQKFRIENKGTSQKYYRVTNKEWEKLWLAAVSAGEHPLFHVRVLRDDTAKAEFVVMETNLLEVVFDIEVIRVATQSVKSVQIRQHLPMVGAAYKGSVRYKRHLLSPVKRRKPHDIVILPWSRAKEALSAYSEKPE